METKIQNFIESGSCSKAKLKYVWSLIFDDWEDFPEDADEAGGLLVEELPSLDDEALRKVYKKLFGEEWYEEDEE